MFSLLQSTSAALADWYFYSGQPVLAACCHLAVGDITVSLFSCPVRVRCTSPLLHSVSWNTLPSNHGHLWWHFLLTCWFEGSGLFRGKGWIILRREKVVLSPWPLSPTLTYLSPGSLGGKCYAHARTWISKPIVQRIIHQAPTFYSLRNSDLNCSVAYFSSRSLHCRNSFEGMNWNWPSVWEWWLATTVTCITKLLNIWPENVKDLGNGEDYQ